jgi:hypothetical protein
MINGDSGWWFQTWLDDFPFHIWDVIRQPLTNSIFFQDGVFAPLTRFSMCFQIVHIHQSLYQLNVVELMPLVGDV